MTEVLLRIGTPAADIVAVEPDPAMLSQLRATFPAVRALAGTAEEIPLPAGSVDAIMVGQALHWFDITRAYTDMWRVLAPGGVLTAVWNLDDDSVPWVAEMKRVSKSSVSLKASRPRGLPLSAEFPEFVRAEFPHVQRRTAESMAATIGTHSHLLVLDDAERREVTRRILDHLRATPETAEGEFELPMVTLGVRARRG
jgi:ubiquinone/menaquinone biosynthesis C-methylase UbiE